MRVQKPWAGTDVVHGCMEEGAGGRSGERQGGLKGREGERQGHRHWSSAHRVNVVHGCVEGGGEGLGVEGSAARTVVGYRVRPLPHRPRGQGRKGACRACQLPHSSLACLNHFPLPSFDEAFPLTYQIRHAQCCQCTAC